MNRKLESCIGTFCFTFSDKASMLGKHFQVKAAKSLKRFHFSLKKVLVYVSDTVFTVNLKSSEMS